VTVSARRTAAKYALESHRVSERKASGAFRIARSVMRYTPRPAVDEERLRERIRILAMENRRYGCRRVTAVLRREGWLVNVKRVHRIWKDEGLSLKRKRPKRRQYGPRGEVKRKAEGPNDVWSWDFMHDCTVNGRQFKILNVVDEFTREVLVMRVGTRIDSMDVIASMKMLAEKRGMPKHIRSDNGPEFVANALKKWLCDEGCGTIYIEPGSPWQNAYIESFNGKVRDECLNMNVFENGHHAKDVVSEWMNEYNEFRPHSSLGYETPREFAARYYSSLRATPSGTGNTDRLENPKLQVVLK
jgi:transposase InsO family protein